MPHYTAYDDKIANSRKGQIIRIRDVFVNAAQQLDFSCKRMRRRRKTCDNMRLIKQIQEERTMENAADFTDLSSNDAKSAEMRMGANWFYWLALLSVISTFLVYVVNFQTHFIGLGMSEYLDNRGAQSGTELGKGMAFAFELAIAGIFAAFGYFARKGSDMAFIVGLFVYIFDAVVLLGYREFFAFGVHLLVMFFIFKGLLASRRRYDPSVDKTGA